MAYDEMLSQDDSEHFMAGMQSTESAPFDFVKQDHNAHSIAIVPELFARSRQGIQYLPESHRGFLVVASAVVYDASAEHPRWGIYTSGNFKAKLREEDRDPLDVPDIPKVCAEMDILFRAEDHGYQWVGAMVVAATINRNRIEAVTGVSSATLHPCEDCGEVFKNSDLIDRHTPIFTTGSASEFNKYQLQSYGQYERRYSRYRHGENFEDAKLREYIASEWPYRRDRYLHRAKREKILGSGRADNPKKEKAQRLLKLKMMSMPLEFKKAA